MYCITHVVVDGFRGVARVVGLVGAGRRVSRVRSVVIRLGIFITLVVVSSRCGCVVVTNRSGYSTMVSGGAVSQVASASHMQQESGECALSYEHVSILIISKGGFSIFYRYFSYISLMFMQVNCIKPISMS